MNKKGSAGEFFIGLGIFIAVFLVVFTILGSQSNINIPGISEFIQSGNVWGGIYDFGVKIINVLKEISVPEGLDNANYDIIALALFLLVWIIGTKSLKSFLSPVIAFLVAGLVAVIAARGLTATIIQDYVVASPVAASAFLIGILPVLMIYGFMQNWHSGKFLVKWMVWIVCAVTYVMVFAWGFQSITLGWVYFAFIMIAGFVDCFAPLFKYGMRKNKARSIGSFIAMSHNDITSWEEAEKAAWKTGTRQVNAAPWDMH
jgi:hypothetical protein